MGRGGSSSTANGFSAVLGTGRRGSSDKSLLHSMTPNKVAGERADKLARLAFQEGQPQALLRELHQHYELIAPERPLLHQLYQRLLDTQLVKQEFFEDGKLSGQMHNVEVLRQDARTIVQEPAPSSKLHLVRDKETVCGKTVTKRLTPARRGTWHHIDQPQHYRCQECAASAAQFPETQESGFYVWGYDIDEKRWRREARVETERDLKVGLRDGTIPDLERLDSRTESAYHRVLAQQLVPMFLKEAEEAAPRILNRRLRATELAAVRKITADEWQWFLGAAFYRAWKEPREDRLRVRKFFHDLLVKHGATSAPPTDGND